MCRCECGAANCVGWLGGRSAAQRAHESMRDSDDDAAEGAIYIDEGAEGATKVQQLGAGPTLPTVRTPCSHRPPAPVPRGRHMCGEVAQRTATGRRWSAANTVLAGCMDGCRRELWSWGAPGFLKAWRV